MEELELQVRRAVAEERGVALERVTLHSTLARDLGMDGDDAVDFFRQFETNFRVDLRALWAAWPAYFGPEAWGLTGLVIFAIPIACGGTILLFATRWMHLRISGWLEFAAFTVLGLFLWFLWSRVNFWPAAHLTPALRSRKEITVSDLLAAARRGAWPG